MRTQRQPLDPEKIRRAALRDTRYALRATRTRGSIVITTLIFSVVFLFLITALAGFVLVQQNVQEARESQERALQIAEAGLEYYKWYLAHYPSDLQDGTGGPGPYEHDYDDPEGGTIGKFSLEITGTSSCNTLAFADITSTGWTLDRPELTRTVHARYARPSVAEYAYLVNSNVWVGSDREIHGPYHSNGGIRMDGTSDSIVASAQEEWECTSSFGCDPASTTPGVWGDGSDSSLWVYPLSSIDFTGITLDIANIKDKAQNEGGLYFPQVSGATSRRGYRVMINADRTLDVWEVNDSEKVWSYDNISDPSQPWNQRYELISDESYLGNFAMPPECSVAFFEDRVWIEGDVSGRMTIASGDVTNSNYNTDVLLTGSIEYVNGSDTDGLTLIAQNSVRIALESPDSMVLNGIMVAQEGNFGRNHYQTDPPKDVPETHNAYVKRSDLTMQGSIVANERVGTKWLSGGVYASGYATRTNSYDPQLAELPPPLTPNVTDDYRFLEWEEVE